jgi:hypothetical protein
VFHAAAAEVAQAGSEQHNGQVGRITQPLEQPNGGVAEKALGDGYGIKYLGAGTHAVGKRREAGVVGLAVGAGAAEQK